MYSIDTVGLCEICYRHVDARRFEENGEIWIEKNCPVHGYSKYIVEKDAEFYHSLVRDETYYNPSSYGIEVTDRCNLTCPHCYHLPDNKIVDRSINSIINEMHTMYPNDGWSMTLAGAEPTMRKDLPQVVKALRDLEKDPNYKPRDILIVTNGVLLERVQLVRDLVEAGLFAATVSLNHPTYQGEFTHSRQRQGIQNCLNEGLKLTNINHTLSYWDQLEDVLTTNQSFGNSAEEYRVRGGTDIGRSPDEPRKFISDLVKEAQAISERKGWDFKLINADNNVYHVMAEINGLPHRFIQWADVTTLDLEQCNSGPWCNFAKTPWVSNMLHQCILRDGLVNKGLEAPDEIPIKYRRMYQYGLEQNDKRN